MRRILTFLATLLVALPAWGDADASARAARPSWVPRVSLLAGPVVGGDDRGLGPGVLAGGSFGLGRRGDDFEGGLRLDLDVAGGTRGARFVGPALSAYVGSTITEGQGGSLRHSLGVGVSTFMRCSGDDCRAEPGALLTLDLFASRVDGGLECGGRLLADYVPEEGAWAAAALAMCGWAWR